MTLWGEHADLSLQRRPRKTPLLNASTFTHIDGFRTIQGHSREYFGITGLKRCVVCQITGYCPGGTLTPPLQTAQPFYCTAHMRESWGQHEVPLHG